MDELHQERLSTLSLPLGSRSVGKPLGHLALHTLGVRIVSLRRSSGKTIPPTDDLLFEGGDTLVLSGRAETLAVAEQKLLKGA